MNRKQWVDLTCEHCKAAFSVTPARAHKAKFCGRGCADEAQRGPRKATPCKHCGKTFMAELDHGKWQKFCGRACFEASAPTPAWKTCPTCDGAFLATASSKDKSPDGLRKYCSQKCAHAGLKRGDTKTCVQCGEAFYLSPSTKRQRPEDGCCSWDCARAFYVKERAHGWKGGEYTPTATGERFLLLPREGWVGKYVGEHRVIAMQAIGRGLQRHEYVLRINRMENDNRPENLFICTNSEFGKRRNGSLPWPTKSNLDTYR